MSEEKQPSESSWQRLWRRPRARWLLGIPLGGLAMFVVGIGFWASFEAVLAATNTETFCISCHEMRAFVYEEFKQTVHHKNASGVRATCPDCHVPKPFAYKMIRKIQATFVEVPNHILGSIDTPEKFEAKRLHLAERVWKGMRASDSRECRNCHSFEGMDIELQDRSARKKHTAKHIQSTGETCIDCHQGIAHQLPDIVAETED